MLNVVITGSSKGIGLGLAEEFSRRGNNVLISARNESDLQSASLQLKKVASSDGKIITRPCDVANVDEMQALWDTAAREFTSVDIWINNAGLARTTWSISEIPQAELEAMLRTNMFGTINGCRVAIAGMQSQETGGKVFNVLGGGSDGEYFPGMGVYGTTKRGLDYFTRALVKELKGSNVLIGKIRPGMIITEAVVREAKADPENFEKSRASMNNLVDRIETVAPYLVDEMIKFNKPGAKIAWLNGGKIAIRMMKAKIRPRADQFSDFGL